MGDIASAAGVVRRTVYGHFPTRADLVRNLAQHAVDEILAVIAQVDVPDTAIAAVWADFVAELWPLTRRYRVLLALRRGEYGEEIHALLRPVDKSLASLVQRGRDDGSFGDHLPAGVMSQIAFTAVFAVADSNRSGELLDVRAAIVTSLLVMGVNDTDARVLGDTRSGV